MKHKHLFKKIKETKTTISNDFYNIGPNGIYYLSVSIFSLNKQTYYYKLKLKTYVTNHIIFSYSFISHHRELPLYLIADNNFFITQINNESSLGVYSIKEKTLSIVNTNIDFLYSLELYLDEIYLNHSDTPSFYLQEGKLYVKE